MFLGHATTAQAWHEVIQQTKNRSRKGAEDDAVDVDWTQTAKG